MNLNRNLNGKVFSHDRFKSPDNPLCFLAEQVWTGADLNGPTFHQPARQMSFTVVFGRSWTGNTKSRDTSLSLGSLPSVNFHWGVVGHWYTFYWPTVQYHSGLCELVCLYYAVGEIVHLNNPSWPRSGMPKKEGWPLPWIPFWQYLDLFENRALDIVEIFRDFIAFSSILLKSPNNKRSIHPI